MDKIAAGIIDKLSIIGFFNVIITGGVFLYGISPILDRYVPGLFYSSLGVENDLEKIIVICLLCYIFGSALKSMQSVLFKGVRTRIVNECLSCAENTQKKGRGNDIIKNKYKREGVIALAVKLFKEKELGDFDPEDKDMNQYFFEYCAYSNLIKGYGGRAEQVSESATFYEQLVVAFFTLVTVGVLLSLFTDNQVWIYCLGYLAMGGVFMSRAYICRLNWVRTVFSTYEAAADKEAEKKA